MHLSHLHIRFVKGLAGTGKTWSIAKYVRSAIATSELEHRGAIGILLCGPTGLSAHALFQSSDMEEAKPYIYFWGTLASAKGLIYSAYRRKFDTDKFIAEIEMYKTIVIVVDEFFAASKDPLQAFAKLLDAVVRSKKVIYIVTSGDPAQLTPPDNSAMSGQVLFMDILRATYNSFFIDDNHKDVELACMQTFMRYSYASDNFRTHFEALLHGIARQAMGSGLVEMQDAEYLVRHWVNNQIPKDIDPNCENVTYICWTNAAVASRIQNHRARLFEEGKLSQSMMMAVPSTIKYTPSLPDALVIPFGEVQSFYAGEPVILTRNLDVRGGIVNGSCGKVVGTLHNGKEAIVGLAVDFGDVRVNVPYVPEFEAQMQKAKYPQERHLPLASRFAITAHKSQGQTYRDGIVVIDNSILKGPSELLYVALSRSTRPELICFETQDPEAIVHALLRSGREDTTLRENRKKLMDMWNPAFFESSRSKRSRK